MGTCDVLALSMVHLYGKEIGFLDFSVHYPEAVNGLHSFRTNGLVSQLMRLGGGGDFFRTWIDSNVFWTIFNIS